MTSRRMPLALLGALALTATTAGMASAHVTVDPETASADDYAVLTFSVPHGCEGSSTTALAIQIPAPITSVTPTAHPSWDVETVTEEITDTATDAHGAPVTERTAEVRYTARTPLPDSLRDSFELAVHLPAETAGTTLTFPAVQTCEEGESAWVQIASEGQDPHALELPAPQVTVAEPHATPAQDASHATTVPAQAPTTIAVVALAVASLALGTGVLALFRRRRTA